MGSVYARKPRRNTRTRAGKKVRRRLARLKASGKRGNNRDGKINTIVGCEAEQVHGLAGGVYNI